MDRNSVSTNANAMRLSRAWVVERKRDFIRLSEYCEQLISENESLRGKLSEAERESCQLRKEFEESQDSIWKYEIEVSKLQAQLQTVEAASILEEEHEHTSDTTKSARAQPRRESSVANASSPEDEGALKSEKLNESDEVMQLRPRKESVTKEDDEEPLSAPPTPEPTAETSVPARPMRTLMASRLRTAPQPSAAMMRSRGSMPTMLYACDVCAKKFPSRLSVQNHRNRKHAGVAACAFKTSRMNRRRFSAVDERSLDTADESVGEILPVRQTPTFEPRRHKCEMCDLAFTRRDSLRHHMMRHTGARPHQCDQCGFAFRQKSNLERHIRNHSCRLIKGAPTESNDLIGSDLAQLFAAGGVEQLGEGAGEEWGDDGAMLPVEFAEASPSNVKVETGEEEGFEGRQEAEASGTSSSPSGGEFEPVSALQLMASGGAPTLVPRLHLSAGIPQRAPLAFSASQAFANKALAKAHSYSRPSTGPYRCEVCSRTCDCVSSLRRHMMTHTGEQPHACGICGRRFSLKSNLDRHVRDVCSKATIQQ